MVKLEIINDDVPVASQEKAFDENVDISSDEEYEEDEFDINETFSERIIALQDIVPPHVRARVSNTFSSASSLLGSAASLGGKGLWIFTSATLLFGIPFGLCLTEDLTEGGDLAMAGSEDNMLAPEGQAVTQ